MSNLNKRKMSEAKQSVKEQRGSLEKPTGPDYFNYLNDDCLSKIFKYLPIKQRLDVVTVCKRWRDASQFAWDDIKTLNFKNPSLPWQGDSKELPPAYRTKNCTARILQNCGSSLRELELGSHVNSNILVVIGRHCCNLTKLEVDVSNACHINPFIIKQLQNLSYLRIEGNKGDFSEVLFEALPAETLTELHLSVNPRYSYSTLLSPAPTASQILEKLPKLTALTLGAFGLDQEMFGLITQINQLTYLSLANCTMLRDYLNLSSLTLLTNLEYLNLSSLESLDDDFVVVISKNLKKLRNLHLRRCPEVYNTGILSLSELPQLEELDVAFNEDLSDYPFGHLRNLKKLNVGNCLAVQDAGIIQLLQNSPYIEELNVVNTEVTENLLQVAAGLTESRTNNVQLKVIVEAHLKEAWETRAASFPLLIVDVPSEDIYHRPYYESDDEEDEDIEDEDEDEIGIEYEGENEIVNDGEYAMGIPHVWKIVGGGEEIESENEDEVESNCEDEVEDDDDESSSDSS